MANPRSAQLCFQRGLSVALAKHTHELARNIWLPLVGVLMFLSYRPGPAAVKIARLPSNSIDIDQGLDVNEVAVVLDVAEVLDRAGFRSSQVGLSSGV